MPIALLDAISIPNNPIKPSQVGTVTFGGLSLGDASFKEQYEKTIESPLRFVNICDWVPTFSMLTSPSTKSPFTQLGLGVGIIWETGDFWGNHSMQNIYLPMVQNPDVWMLLNKLPADVPIRIPDDPKE